MSKLKVEYVPVGSLVPYANNPRVHSEKAISAVASSIAEFGFKNPIIVDKDNIIIAGHIRLLAAKKLGLNEVPVIRAEDLTEKQVRAFRIADNRTSEFTEWDTDLLSQEIKDLDDIFTGFDAVEIEDLVGGGVEELAEDDFDVVVPKEATSKPGDIYQLGCHRVMCGDATKPDDMNRLMNGAKADMVFTDPPYNIDYEGGTKEQLKIQNDNMDSDAFYRLLYDSFKCAFDVTKDGGGIYICHAEAESVNFRRAMVDAGWLQKQCIIWAKNSFVLSRQDYHWRHEPILYGWKPGAPHKWYGGRRKDTVFEDLASVTISEEGGRYLLHINDGVHALVLAVPEYEVNYASDDSGTTLWRIERPSRNAEHPTMKPVALVGRAIKNSSGSGDIVLDPFGGSGTTLIAAERIGRVCCMMELDPCYVDVIVERWQSYTGKKARLVK